MMMKKILLLIVTSPLAAGCSRPAAVPRPSATPVVQAAPGTVVGEVDGKPITLADVDVKAAQALMQVREQEYEARRDALNELVNDRILAREAESRRLSREELWKREVDAKVARPSPAEIEQVFLENRLRIGNRTKAEVTPQIEDSLRREALANRGRLFMAELRGKTKYRTDLPQPRTEVPLPADAKVLGPAQAPITLVGYSDYLCPYCQRAEEVLDQVLQQYQGKVRFIHRDFLLGRPRSLEVARAALCAGDQGRFWEYRNSLLRNPTGWGDTELTGHATKLGLKTEPFAACLAGDTHDAVIQASTAEGRDLGITGTPTFFVNGRRLTGARSLEQFQEVIDAELKRADGEKAGG